MATYHEATGLRLRATITGWAAAVSALFAIAHLAWLLLAAALAGWAYISFTQSKTALARFEQELTDSCTSQGAAVMYEGWYGSVHTFSFTNERYADQFKLSNEAKVVRS
jgi:hypothetical protein